MRLVRFFLPAILALGLTWDARGDQADPRLDILFERITLTSDPREAESIEREIWQIWVISNDPVTNGFMQHGIEALTASRLDLAIDFFTKVIERSPGFAEGWNKRATAHYLNGDFAASVNDIERTLALEPRHFGALSGMGLIFLGQGDRIGALSAFERVLEINPHAKGARLHVPRLRELLKGQGA
jgi:tetratricopeptide (TPR) repeat protein